MGGLTAEMDKREGDVQEVGVYKSLDIREYGTSSSSIQVFWIIISLWVSTHLWWTVSAVPKTEMDCVHL